MTESIYQFYAMIFFLLGLIFFLWVFSTIDIGIGFCRMKRFGKRQTPFMVSNCQSILVLC